MMGSIAMTMIARGQVVSNASGHYSDAKGVLKWNPAHSILKSDTLIQNHGISTIISPHLITKPRVLKYNNYLIYLDKKLKKIQNHLSTSKPIIVINYHSNKIRTIYNLKS